MTFLEKDFWQTFQTPNIYDRYRYWNFRWSVVLVRTGTSSSVPLLIISTLSSSRWSIFLKVLEEHCLLNSILTIPCVYRYCDIRPRECIGKYCPWEVFSNTLIASKYQRNTSLQWLMTVLQSILPWQWWGKEYYSILLKPKTLFHVFKP